jgi:hypothetical protein
MVTILAQLLKRSGENPERKASSQKAFERVRFNFDERAGAALLLVRSAICLHSLDGKS